MSFFQYISNTFNNINFFNFFIIHDNFFSIIFIRFDYNLTISSEHIFNIITKISFDTKIQQFFHIKTHNIEHITIIKLI